MYCTVLYCTTAAAVNPITVNQSTIPHLIMCNCNLTVLLNLIPLYPNIYTAILYAYNHIQCEQWQMDFLKNILNYAINTAHNVMFVASIIYIENFICKPNKKNVNFAIKSLEGSLGLEEVKARRISRRSAQGIFEVSL